MPRMAQPDEVTCGPTCLHQVFLFYRDVRPLPQILEALQRNPDGGTLAVYLGLTALSLGYHAALYPLGLRIVDPTWRGWSLQNIRERLVQRARVQTDDGLRAEHEAYVQFLDLGGKLFVEELSPALLVRILKREHPVICGLSATYLYGTMRERSDDLEYDDLRGESTGHFVVLCGYTGSGLHFHVRDPSVHVPFSATGRYTVGAQRLTNAILLGDATRDAVLLEVWPKSKPRAPTGPDPRPA
ncbi:MAG: C39 family peptidase [Myxococcota bacterium]